MSDPALTAVHQQIAETLDAEGLGDSAWDFFAVCPQGHRHAVSAMATYCRVCVNQWIDGGGSSLGNSRERVWQAHRDNPEWRPDWIIREAGRDPRNFSDTVILLAVIDEWCAFRGARWSMGRTAGWQSEAVIRRLLPDNHVRVFRLEQDADPIQVLFIVWQQALGLTGDADAVS